MDLWPEILTSGHTNYFKRALINVCSLSLFLPVRNQLLEAFDKFQFIFENNLGLELNF
jgi:hypothetical protein